MLFSLHKENFIMHIQLLNMIKILSSVISSSVTRSPDSQSIKVEFMSTRKTQRVLTFFNILYFDFARSFFQNVLF